MSTVMSWGRWPRLQQQSVGLVSRFDSLPVAGEPLLPFGNGRSYGDVCLNEGGTLLATRALDRFISFDRETGVLECESGVLLNEIIELALPHGWFPPVTPGTAYVTVGGAIANDVHGKNHHGFGTFAHHLLSFELLRSDSGVLQCTADSHPELFRATVGGLGLTGLIRRACLQLRRVPGPWIIGDSLRFESLAEFFRLASASDRDFEYTVAWIDCSRRGGNGRGIFMRGNHARHDAPLPAARTRRFPFVPPISPITGLTVDAFNELYYRRPAAQVHNMRWDYRSYLYPLDGILEWNRVYGARGFFQYQCVVPNGPAPDAVAEMLKLIAASGQGSALSVLKQFGDRESLGMMSFARPGVTLALDFPNRGESTLKLLDSLDQITRSAGGAVYPAKDARMSSAAFREYFPNWQDFARHIDPRFSSSFWRRVTKDPT